MPDVNALPLDTEHIIASTSFTIGKSFLTQLLMAVSPSL